MLCETRKEKSHDIDTTRATKTFFWICTFGFKYVVSHWKARINEAVEAETLDVLSCIWQELQYQRKKRKPHI